MNWKLKGFKYLEKRRKYSDEKVTSDMAEVKSLQLKYDLWSLCLNFYVCNKSSIFYQKYYFQSKFSHNMVMKEEPKFWTVEYEWKELFFQ